MNGSPDLCRRRRHVDVLHAVILQRVDDGIDDIDEQAESSAPPQQQEENGNEEGLSLDFEAKDTENGDTEQKRKATASPAPKTS